MLEKIFFEAFHHNPDPISINSPRDMRFIQINEAFSKTLGYELHELTGMFPQHIWVIPRQFEHSVRELQEKGYLRDFEAQLKCKSGEIKTLLISIDIFEVASDPYVIVIGKDITDRKQMEKQLQEERNFNAAILDNTSDLIVVYDREGRIVNCNRAFKTVYDCDFKNIIGAYVGDSLFAPQDIKNIKGWLEKPVLNQNVINIPYKHENHLVTREGASRLISWNTTFLVGNHGSYTYALSTGNDITQQRVTEERLRESEAELRSIYENANGIIYTLSKEGIFIYVSQGWTENLGHDINEVKGHSFEIFVHPEDISKCRAFLEIIMATGKPQKGVEYRVKHRDGTWRWHTSSGAVVRDESGNPAYYVGMAVDISDRKQAEEALLISEEKFSKAFLSIPDPITITTLGEGCYVEVNDAFLRTSGYERAEVIGRTAMDLNIWFDAQERDLLVEQLREKGYIRRGEEGRFRTKSGEIRSFLYSTEVINMDGKPHLLWVTKDITERKKAEEEIKYLSFYDKLTGLYNRAYFEQELKRLDTERQLPISLIMGDVNGLKLINDALGHQEGDHLLKVVAGILRSSCRQEDIVARWGGDEFIILLPGSDHRTVVKIVERIKKNCKNSNELPIDISVSLGLAIKSLTAQDISITIKEAEDKMYRNKLLASKSTRSSFLNSLAKTLSARSHETEEHCRRMQDMALKLGQYINLPDSECDNLKLLAALHDIGKIALPSDILEKPGKLSPHEWESVKKHPEIGYRIALSSPELASIAEAILHHHERWDGTGYPLGLKGEAIPLISRIISLVDAYDVMINGRTYQKAISPQEAWAEIERCAGTQFDPRLVRKAIAVFSTPLSTSNH